MGSLLSKIMATLVRRSEDELYVATDYRIIFEDEVLLVVDKPAPIPVHRVGRFVNKNLLSILYRDGYGEEGSLHLVNRLDSETSGVLLIAKSREAAGKLGIQFQDRKVQKEYSALVFGVLEKRQGVIDLRLGTTEKNQLFGRVADLEGEECITYFEVIEDNDEFSLLRIKPCLFSRTPKTRAEYSFWTFLS